LFLLLLTPLVEPVFLARRGRGAGDDAVSVNRGGPSSTNLRSVVDRLYGNNPLPI